MTHLLNNEIRHLPKEEPLKKIQNDRQKLVSWLIDIQEKCNLQTSSFHYAINILDRYLSLSEVPRKKLQLTGCVAMWLSAKYNEVRVPDVSDFVYMSDDAFTTKEMKEMEESVVNKLKFQFSVSTSYHFAKRYVHIMKNYMPSEKIKERLGYLVKYYIEFAVFPSELFGKKYSLIAAGSTLAAAYWLDTKFVWKKSISKAIGYTRKELDPVMKVLKKLIYDRKPKKIFNPLVRKYEKESNGRVALMRYKSEISG